MIFRLHRPHWGPLGFSVLSQLCFLGRTEVKSVRRGKSRRRDLSVWLQSAAAVIAAVAVGTVAVGTGLLVNRIFYSNVTGSVL